MNQTKKKIIRPTALAFLLALGLSAAMPAGAGTAYAQPVQEGQPAGEASGDTAQGGYWMNLEEGPGVAQWVDENGQVTEEPGVKPEEESQPAAETGEPAGEEAAEGGEAAGEEAAETGETAGEEAAGRVIDPARPMVALTFDDGPYAPVGNQIMDCLAEYGGKATFFVVGNRCASYGEEMRRMAAEGHEIGNHTYEHRYLDKLGAADIQYQINKGNEAIAAASGVSPTLVRLPGGRKNDTVMANVPMPMIMWTIDTLDWKTKNAQNTVDTVLNQVRDGDIVLMHELYGASGQAAPQLIPELTRRGYQLVTVSEMAQYRGGLQPGQIYYSFRP